jgi:hypothetical protein
MWVPLDLIRAATRGRPYVQFMRMPPCGERLKMDRILEWRP